MSRASSLEFLIPAVFFSRSPAVSFTHAHTLFSPLLHAGDLPTEYEKGVNLSGGQKQRIALARAVYSGARTLVLDDPFSAVDATVGEHLFDKCLRGEVRHASTLLITNQLHFLPRCDHVYVIDGGRIVASGTYAEIERTGFNFAELRAKTEQEKADDADKADRAAKDGKEAAPALVRKRSTSVSKAAAAAAKAADGGSASAAASVGDIQIESIDDEKDDADADEDADEIDGAIVKAPASKGAAALAAEQAARTAAATAAGAVLVQEEDRGAGSVGWGAYGKLLSAMGGFCFCFFLVVFLVAGQVCIIGADIWLSMWSARAFDRPDSFYVLVLALIGVAAFVCLLAKSYVLAYASARCSQLLHDDMLGSVMRAPSRFFDATPTGRIVNRFSKVCGAGGGRQCDCIFVLASE